MYYAYRNSVLFAGFRFTTVSCNSYTFSILLGHAYTRTRPPEPPDRDVGRDKLKRNTSGAMCSGRPNKNQKWAAADNPAHVHNFEPKKLTAGRIDGESAASTGQSPLLSPLLGQRLWRAASRLVSRTTQSPRHLWRRPRRLSCTLVLWPRRCHSAPAIGGCPGRGDEDPAAPTRGQTRLHRGCDRRGRFRPCQVLTPWPASRSRPSPATS